MASVIMWEWPGNEASHVSVCQEDRDRKLLSVHVIQSAVTICKFHFLHFLCAGGKFPIVSAGTGRYVVSSLVPRPSPPSSF